MAFKPVKGVGVVMGKHVCAGLVGLVCVALCQLAHAQSAGVDPQGSAPELNRHIGIGALVAGPMLSIGLGAATVASLALDRSNPPAGVWAAVGAWGLAAQVASIGLTVYGAVMLARSRSQRTAPSRVAFVLAPYAAPGSVGVTAAWRF